MTGILAVNAFLHGKKYTELDDLLLAGAKAWGMQLQIKTNLELRLEVPKADFVLFWDKDVSLAHALEQQGLPVFNSAKAIALCDNKALTYQALLGTVPQPETMAAPITYFEGSNFSPFIDGAIERLGLPLVFKECYGSFGAQVFLCHSKEEIERHITARPFLLQKFCKESAGHDKRIEVIGGRCVAAMERYNPADFRANITNGGQMRPYTPTREEEALALAATEKLGLLFGGVDLLEDGTVCEVNSNAHLVNLKKCTGIDTAPLLFRAIQEALQ